VIPAPCSCPDCSGKLAKLGEDVTETLEVIPRQWKVIQTVREKFTCRSCEKITQPPAPFHPIARGRAGASLLAMILHGKFGNHLPLNRQSESFAREGIDRGVSTLADWVGTCTGTLAPLVALIRSHVLGAARIHGDDTTVPVLAKMRTKTGRESRHRRWRRRQGVAVLHEAGRAGANGRKRAPRMGRSQGLFGATVAAPSRRVHAAENM
jgi:transposase